jgi:BlaI family transcriptional regulator, penicillinase repressor
MEHAAKRGLSRRERQIMEVLHRAGKMTAAEVRAGMRDAPSDSAVRTTLRILEEKGHVRHQEDGGRYVYSPVASRQTARRSALREVLATFFDGSPSQAVAALLDVSAKKLSEEELNRLEELVRKARESS